MQQIERMPWSSEGIIGAIASGLVGWFAASVTKVSKAEHKELLARVDMIEKDLKSHMTRSEFDSAFSKVERLVWDFRSEARSEFKDLKSELKTKT